MWPLTNWEAPGLHHQPDSRLHPSDHRTGSAVRLLPRVCSVWGEMKRLLIEVWLSALLMWAIWTERTGQTGRGQRGNEEKFLADREGLFQRSAAPSFSPPSEFRIRLGSQGKAATRRDVDWEFNEKSKGQQLVFKTHSIPITWLCCHKSWL